MEDAKEEHVCGRTCERGCCYQQELSRVQKHQEFAAEIAEIENGPKDVPDIPDVVSLNSKLTELIVAASQAGVPVSPSFARQCSLWLTHFTVTRERAINILRIQNHEINALRAENARLHQQLASGNNTNLPSVSESEQQTQCTILILGASGLLGRAVLKEFQANTPYKVIGTGFSRASSAPGLVKLDVTDEAATAEFLRALSPDCVVNCVAERRPDACEAEEGPGSPAWRLNVGLPQLLRAHALRAPGCKVVHVSTDYVFDGTAPPYAPGAEPRPLNAYGRLKRAAEEALLAAAPGGAAGAATEVLRVPVLYGEAADRGESAVTCLLGDVLDASRPRRVDNWGARYPTHTRDVARALRRLVDLTMAPGGGGGGGGAGGGGRGGSAAATSAAGGGGRVWHFSADETQPDGRPYTKYALCQLMGEVLGLSTSHLAPDDAPPAGAPRPRDCHLRSSAALRCAAAGAKGAQTERATVPLADGLREVLAPFVPPLSSI